MELPIVGQVTDPTTLDLDPIVVPVCAYKLETREEVIERFPFKPQMPPGTIALMERLGANPDTFGINATLMCLERCVMSDARERWVEFLDREDLAVEVDTLASLLRALMEHYGQRPTKRSSGSSRTGKRSGRTSKAAPLSAA